MLEVRTTRCREFGHRDFVLELEDCGIPEGHVQAVVKNIEDMVAAGSVFEPGETLQVGWMVTQVQRYDATHLTLVEPDLKSLPVSYTAGVTQTLRHLSLQVFMLESVLSAEDMHATSMLQSVVVCRNYDQSLDFFFDRRTPGDESDSGWFIGCLNKDHDHGEVENLRKTSLYEVLVRQPGIRSFALFPVGTTVIGRDGKHPQVFKEGELLPVRDGSLLDLWMNQ
jgi:hypothetical protein